MQAVNIIGGVLLLTLGRKIFWLFVAASGFYAGFELESRYLNIQPEWVALLIALALGVVGALLAYYSQKLVVGVAGFLAGAFIASRLVSYLGAQAQGWEWLFILIGGVVGILLMFAIFEWALTILSSLAGTILIVEGLKLTGPAELVAGVLLFLVGVVFQAGLDRRLGSARRASR